VKQISPDQTADHLDQPHEHGAGLLDGLTGVGDQGEAPLTLLLIGTVKLSRSGPVTG